MASLEGAMTDAILYLSAPTSWRIEIEGVWQGIGSVDECTLDHFFIRVSPNMELSGSPLSGTHPGPYSTLDEAMQAIAAKLGGKCALWRPWR
jgi:hypothetical protein